MIPQVLENRTSDFDHAKIQINIVVQMSLITIFSAFLNSFISFIIIRVAISENNNHVLEF